MIYEGIPWKKGDPLPFQPGDVLYSVYPYGGYHISEVKIDAVAVFPDCCHPMLDDDIYNITENPDPKVDLLDYLFLTRADAERWLEKNRPDPPWIMTDATEWLSPAEYVPSVFSDDCLGSCYVKVRTDHGIEKMDAYFDDGSKYPEDRGFWDGKSRSSKHIENVVAWISHKEWDPEK